MKKVIGIAKEIVIAMIILVFMIGVWFGAILQTSYRLCQVTAEEIMEVENVHR